MPLVELITNKTSLALIAAGGYAIATLLMKVAASETTLALLAGIVAVLVVTVAAEILLLRQVDLGLAYIAVIATETFLVLSFTFLLGEPLSSREMVGGALVVSGAALVSF